MDKTIDLDKLKNSLNGLLPKDIYVKNVEICMLYTSDAADERTSVVLG